MLRSYEEYRNNYDLTFAALQSLECARPPGIIHRRYHRRGPRSARALARRACRIQDVIDLVPLGGGLC